MADRASYCVSELLGTGSFCGFSELADLRAVFCGPAFPETACVSLPVQSQAMNYASELDTARTVYLSQPVCLKTTPMPVPRVWVAGIYRSLHLSWLPG